MNDKKFPTEDMCRVFNILIRISPYYFDQSEQLLYGNSQAQKEQDEQVHQKFLRELVGRIRHSIYNIPKSQFTLTMSNLVEFRQAEIAAKFVNILKEIIR